MNKPLVSVVMSTYNEEKYVLASINSILNQTYENIEIIIVDDASTDNTVSLIENIATDKIRLYINDTNKKLAHNLNFAISKAKGKYVARMDADDISRRERIETQVEYLEKHKDVDVVASYAKTFGDSDIIKKSPCTHEGIKAALLFTNPLCHPTVMFRKSSIDFGYDESCAAGQDYELWARIIDRKKFSVLSDVLLDYRVIKRQRNPSYLQLQKASALRAKKYLFDKLFSYERNVFWDTFKSLVDVDFTDFEPKTQEQMKSIVAFADQLIETNKLKKVFDEHELIKALSTTVFQQWYLSFLKTDVSSKIFMKSNYVRALRQETVLMKMKVIYKLGKKKILK
ncbi:MULTISPECIES: glycosyltransferase family 2 protein [Clostridia]|uniref:glycosyltransferase family 2 protein n=1 Tax=Clostridia TaxID=186801 RepID=UPI000E4DE5FE|nr:MULTISPECIES: glycosyltransferase family 2 protein [Clostridia]RHV70460.1 glycosyltransferase family 2 protein [Roseburia sp. OM02-15]